MSIKLNPEREVIECEGIGYSYTQIREWAMSRVPENIPFIITAHGGDNCFEIEEKGIKVKQRFYLGKE